MLQQIENLFPFSNHAESDESLETILAVCYQIARARAKQVKQTTFKNETRSGLGETVTDEWRAESEVRDDEQ
jgi:hypothetical protein